MLNAEKNTLENKEDIISNILGPELQTKKKIVVAMSGGVDSSTVAAILHDAGHEVIGITMQLYDHGEAVKKTGTCCAGQDIYDAKLVANKLGIPHYVLNYESLFKQAVIDDFVDSYMQGETPLPCVRCNQSVKFKDLLRVSKELGGELMATGHYLRKIQNTNNKYELHQAVEKKKDQSYFLFATTKEQMENLIFPLGNIDKEQTRELALYYDLPVAEKSDSQDICFVPDGNYRDVVLKLRPSANIKGKILHIDGYQIGEHEGIINYTIGQRRGLNISNHGKPLYVIKIDTLNNIVYVGPKSDLYKIDFIVKDINWLASELEIDNLDVEVKIRSTMDPVKAKLHYKNENIIVSLEEPETAITPGQACVIYKGSRMLGGGWIGKQDLSSNK